ncbi:MAG TPA: hypothetical protein VK157_06395 [Phycisphaerales bacterium]|nr:hypothetical protein [Phycisphaerales bacterium]
MRRSLSALLFASVSASAFAQAPVTLGVMFRTGGQTSGLNPILYDVNTSTGAATNPRNVNVNNTVGIAIDPATGVLYGLTDQFGRINNISGQGGKNLIFTINPTTGTATAVGRVDPTGIFQVFEGDIAFSPADGSFWGVTTLINTARLFTIDKTTGAAALGAVVQPSTGTDLDISALTFDSAGTMYLLDTRYPINPGPALLLRVDKDSGEILRSWNTGIAMGAVAGMAFVNGQLFITDGDTAGTNRLYRFDFDSGEIIDVGPTNAAGGIYQGLAGLVHGCVGGPCATLACDDIDFNNNDVFPEDQDVIDFFNVLAGADCPACNDIDFNNNGVFPEDQDVIDFFNVLAGGACVP